ncbi:MAG TPA: response regulator [Candidatus Aminicenantes bacterium]|nr:response regulator [Candidatus Aminicenantes bacterium]
MSKYRVLLADSSYTIRRIVELSFSEESDIELITFESGTPLREKLLELTPHIVLVDIRLPEFNGYQVCKFVNGSEALAHTRVFLLKGGFEPINEELLKELEYQEIITKPFDSNALVKAVKEILEEDRPEAPAPREEADISDSFPEDLPEISGFEEESVEDISFSDVSDEVSSDQAPKVAQKSDTSDTDDFIRDEVVPSEEITQGAQPERDDSLRPDDNAEEIPNPFQENSRESDIDELLEKEIERERQTHQDEPDFGAPQTGEFRFEPMEPADSLHKEAEDSETGVEEEKPEPSSVDESGADAEPPSPQQSGSPDTLSEAELAQAFAEAPEPRQRDDIFAPLETTEPESETPPPIPEPEPPAEPEPTTPIEIEPTFQSDTEEPTYSIDADTDAERILDDLDKLSAQTKPTEDTATANKDQDEGESEPQTGAIDPQQLTHRLEDKLSIAVKEILWEVVPPLAEKIIKAEIRRLESEVESGET